MTLQTTTAYATEDSRTIIDAVLDEYVCYGGPVIQRREVLASLRRRGFDARAIDFWVFGTRTVPAPADPAAELAMHQRIEEQFG